MKRLVALALAAVLAVGALAFVASTEAGAATDVACVGVLPETVPTLAAPGERQARAAEVDMKDTFDDHRSASSPATPSADALGPDTGMVYLV